VRGCASPRAGESSSSSLVLGRRQRAQRWLAPKGSEERHSPKELVTVTKRALKVTFRLGGNPCYEYGHHQWERDQVASTPASDGANERQKVERVVEELLDGSKVVAKTVSPCCQGNGRKAKATKPVGSALRSLPKPLGTTMSSSATAAGAVTTVVGAGLTFAGRDPGLAPDPGAATSRSSTSRHSFRWSQAALWLPGPWPSQSHFGRGMRCSL